MVPSIIAMHLNSSNYEWYIGLTMIIFFSNLIAYISEQKNTITIALYYFSIAVMIIIPTIFYLIKL